MLSTRIALPSPAPGTRRELTVHHFGQPGARPKVYIQAALHADEWPGLLVVQHLLTRLQQAETEGAIQGEVVVVPVANPVGLAQYVNGRVIGRFDLDNSGNFNRNFPDLTDIVLAEVGDRLGDDPAANVSMIREVLVAAAKRLPRIREVDALKAELLTLATDADLVLDLHCDSESLIHLYASRHHTETARELAADLNAAALLLEETPGGNPFDDVTAGVWWRLRERLPESTPLPLACFSTTVELRGQADVYDHYADADAEALLRFLRRRGVIAGDPGPLPEPDYVESPLDGVDILAVPTAGIVAYRRHLGDRVTAGETIAELVTLDGDLPGADRMPIRSRTDGILFARVSEKLARPGQSICKVAGTRKLAHRLPGKLLES